MLMKLQREQRGRKLFFQNYKSCYKPKFRHIKRQWVKQSENLSQKSQKVLWSQNLTCSLVWSYVLMHNGKAKKKNQPQTQTENKACLHPQCNFGGTWPPQSTGSFETWTSQSSSKVIGIKIFSTKHTHTRFHCWRPERYQISQHLSDHFWCSPVSPGGRRRFLHELKPFMWALW